MTKQFKILSFLLVYLMLCDSAISQEIKEFQIECNPDDFSYIYENYQEDIYIPILLTFDGTTWSEVEMRIRGDSSREFDKKSLKVKFNSNPFVTGESTLNFNAEYLDLSYMHSILSSILFEKAGLDCPRMEHVRLYLNGNFLGLYLMVENLDEDFLSARNFDPAGSLYKATKDGACMNIYENIFYHWELKSGNDPYRDGLASLIKEINSTSNENYHQYIQSSFHYSKLISFFSMNMLLSNGSTYYHNYFLFHDVGEDGKWFILPWDLDRSFSDYGVNYPYNRSSGFWTPDNPLLEKTIINEATFSDIKQQSEELFTMYFNGNFIYPIIDSLQDVLTTSVMEDTTDNIPATDIWLAKIADDKQFISERYNQLFSQFNSWPQNFQLNKQNGYFAPEQTIHFTWQPSVDPNGNSISYTFYFSKDQSFQDTGTIKVSGLINEWYDMENTSEEGKYYWMVEATDGNKAVQGFDSYNPIFVYSKIANIVINEINYNSNSSFDPGDWLEIYNPENEAVDLSNWYLKDQDNSHKFLFPSGTTIEAFSYLVLCQNTDQFYSFFPTSVPTIGNIEFGFNSNGELLRLYHYSGYLADSLVYRNEHPWPNDPDGNGPTLELLNSSLDNSMGYNWEGSLENGTPGMINSSYSPDIVNDFLNLDVDFVELYPNPFHNSINITLNVNLPSEIKITILDLYGHVQIEESLGKVVPGKKNITINTKKLIPGVYGCQIFTNIDLYKTFKIIKL